MGSRALRACGRGKWIAQPGVAGERLRVERVEKIAQPRAIQPPEIRGRESSHSAYPQGLGEYILVQAEPQMGIPLLFEPSTAAFDPTL